MSRFRFHHFGLPTSEVRPGESHHPEFGFHASGYHQSAFGIEWLRFDSNCPLHPLIKSVPHVAFVVADLQEAIGTWPIIAPFHQPTANVTTCFVEVAGAPVEFIQFHRPQHEVWPLSPKVDFTFHHVGLSTEQPRPGEIHLPHLRLHCTDHDSNPFGIQWMRYDAECLLPDIVKQVSHVAFQVPNLDQALIGRNVIIQPNSPSPGVTVAFIEENKAPIEFLEFHT